MTFRPATIATEAEAQCEQLRQAQSVEERIEACRRIYVCIRQAAFRQRDWAEMCLYRKDEVQSALQQLDVCIALLEENQTAFLRLLEKNSRKGTDISTVITRIRRRVSRIRQLCEIFD